MGVPIIFKFRAFAKEIVHYRWPATLSERMKQAVTCRTLLRSQELKLIDNQCCKCSTWEPIFRALFNFTLFAVRLLSAEPFCCVRKLFVLCVCWLRSFGSNICQILIQKSEFIYEIVRFLSNFLQPEIVFGCLQCPIIWIVRLFEMYGWLKCPIV